MKTLAPLLWISVTTGCASMPGTPFDALYRDESVDDPRPAVEAEAAPAADSVQVVDAAAEVVRPRKSVPQDLLAVWNDPAFRKRFAESYMAETDIEPDVTEDERDDMLEILELISNDEVDEAIELLQRKRGDSATAVFDFTMGNLHFQREEFHQAVDAYRVAVDKFPRFRRAWDYMGQMQFRNGDYSGAAESLSRVLELGGASAVTYGLLGLAHAKRGQHVAAESAFRMATLLEPGSRDWKTGLADSFFQQGRFADAAALLGGMIVHQPDEPKLWLAQGNAYARLGETKRAAENFEMVDRLGGSTVDSLQNLGDIYANDALYGLAVSAYLRAAKVKPDGSVERALRVAKFMGGNGALDDMRSLLDGIESIQGERLSPEQRVGLVKLRARLAVDAGGGEQEASLLEEVVELDPLDGEALILLGRYSARAGDAEKAIFYFERAANIESFEAKAKLRHAEVLVKQGKYAIALPLLRRAVALDPKEYVQRFLDQVERVSQARK